MADRVPLHMLAGHQINLEDFFFWANMKKISPDFDQNANPSYSFLDVQAFKEFVERKEIPHKFQGIIPAIKFMRQMVDDKRAGLAETKQFIEAVWRTPKPPYWNE